MKALVLVAFGIGGLALGALFFTLASKSDAKYEGEELLVARSAGLSGGYAMTIGGIIAVIWALVEALRLVF